MRRKIPIPEDEFVYSVNSIHKHNEYVTYRGNDIGLIYTDRDITFSSKVEFISLPKRNFPENQLFEFAGWGDLKVRYE